MATNIKGLVVQIGADTTQLGKALDDVNKKSKNLSSELGQINKLLKMDPGNADLLAQKQAVLADAVENTASKLETLKEAEKQVQEQFEKGEVSADQLRALQREIITTTNKLESYENAAKETADALDKIGKEADDAAAEVDDVGDSADKAAREVDQLGDAAEDAANDLDIAGKSMGSFVGNIASDAIQSTVDFLGEAVEVSREYRTEMGKLDTAFTQQGFSSEAATNAYKELVGVLGETDQSVEAANHLAQLTDNERALATWTGDILPGVFATFGDSLPIEGLTEAANETAKVAQVTGPLADALNWAGISEDAFNESLAKCNTEQERQALITETLAGLYGEASASYKTMNADVIAANQANDAWTASLAGVGAEVEPLLTEIKMLGATLLTEITPVISALLNNLPAIGVALAGITASMVAFKVASLAATAATQGMTLAQQAAAAAQAVLNAVMSANPIGLVILAITALVTAFMLLWTNCEGFREFWINLWEKIKTAALNAVEGLKELPAKIHGAILGAVDRVRKWGANLVTEAKTAATNFLNNTVSTLKNLPTALLNAITGAVSKVTQWGKNLLSAAKTAAANMLNGVVSKLREIPAKVLSAINKAVTNVATWGSNMVSKAKSGMQEVVSTVTSTLSGLPSKVLSIGSNLVTGLWNGINNKLSWLKSKISGFASSVLDKLQNLFGVHSPSTETAWIGEMLDEGLADGLLKYSKNPIKAMGTVSRGVLDAAEDMNGLTLERQLSAPKMSAVAIQTADSGILSKLDSILTAIERGQILTIDGNQLVGATASRYDSTLGQRRALAARGAV